jgi:hypothetical protein
MSPLFIYESHAQPRAFFDLDIIYHMGLNNNNSKLSKPLCILLASLLNRTKKEKKRYSVLFSEDVENLNKVRYLSRM